MNRLLRGSTRGALCVVFMVLLSAGCRNRGPQTIETGFGSAGQPGQGAGIGGEAGSGLDWDSGGAGGLPPIDIEGVSGWEGALTPVYFDYDSFVLRADAVETLNQHAAAIKADSGVYMIEGHCDERGTQEYNLALGERRALAVRDYLMRMGVPGSRLVTMSYGEEVPAQPGHDESAWRLNRRCEFSRGR